jgi:hypothetical protein
VQLWSDEFQSEKEAISAERFTDPLEVANRGVYGGLLAYSAACHLPGRFSGGRASTAQEPPCVSRV